MIKYYVLLGNFFHKKNNNYNKKKVSLDKERIIIPELIFNP